jgi:maltose O-acetyltransferase
MRLIGHVIHKYEYFMIQRRWRNLRNKGMKIGKNVNLPMSTWIDTSHCFLISIGDNCGFADECAILAHDAMANEYLDASRIGKVKIHESCHFGMRTVILPGVEIGPRVIIGSGSVIVKDIPPNSVAAGNPARVICSMDDYLTKQKNKLKSSPTFDFSIYDDSVITSEKKKEMLDKLNESDGFMVGGYASYKERNIKTLG